MDTEKGMTSEIMERETSCEPEESMEALMAQQNRFSEMLVGRKPVWVKVIQVTRDHVLVDIGEKREGMVPLSEFGPGAGVLHSPGAGGPSGRPEAPDASATAAPAPAAAPGADVLRTPGASALKEGAQAPADVPAQPEAPGADVLRTPGAAGRSGSPEAPTSDGRRPSVGQRIPVILMSGIRSEGATLLSYRRARESLAWEAALKAYAEKSRVRGTVTMHVKGGFLVDVGGVRAFLPASLADLRPVRVPERMVGTGVRCYIIEASESKKQVVLSRKAVLEEDAAKRRSKILSELRVGEVRIGRIIHSGTAGLLVDIGGLEGFVAAADISWGQPKPASEFARGTKLKVKVIAKPAGGTPDKVSLGIKHLTANPADALRRKYPPKTTVRGKVVEATPAGVRLRLEDGAPAFSAAADCVEGHPYKEGDQVSGVVSGIDSATFHVSVNLRKFDDIKERKRMASYLKAPPPLTLGELLSPAGSAASDDGRGPGDEGGRPGKQAAG